MNVHLSNALKKHFKSPKNIVKKYGVLSQAIGLRMIDLENAGNMFELVKRSGQCHELHNNLKGKWSMHLNSNYRLILEPFLPNDIIPLKPDGSLNLEEITEVTLLDIIDYH